MPLNVNGLISEISEGPSYLKTYRTLDCFTIDAEGYREVFRKLLRRLSEDLCSPENFMDGVYLLPEAFLYSTVSPAITN